MRIRTFGDLIATTVAWTPFLIVIVAVGWVLAVGAVNLETRTNGSQLLVANQTAPTPNRFKEAQQAASDPSLAGLG
ncbi:MAG: hypothetical protein H7123_08370 [Thermoleophilia bacterium]|nr:hypothetical protein [Thermoleophilia bacterium]